VEKKREGVTGEGGGQKLNRRFDMLEKKESDKIASAKQFQRSRGGEDANQKKRIVNRPIARGKDAQSP